MLLVMIEFLAREVYKFTSSYRISDISRSTRGILFIYLNRGVRFSVDTKKVVEETPSPIMTPDKREEMGQKAVMAVNQLIIMEPELLSLLLMMTSITTSWR